MIRKIITTCTFPNLNGASKKFGRVMSLKMSWKLSHVLQIRDCWKSCQNIHTLLV